MALLEIGQKPMVMSHYPHMLHEDIAVWSKFLTKMAEVITRVWYDVHVGQAVSPVDPSSTVQQKVAAGVTRKRIDVVARVGPEFWVIEVKPVAGMGALGQVYSYNRLFALEYETFSPTKPVVVCDVLDDDVIASYGELGVMVFVNE